MAVMSHQVPAFHGHRLLGVVVVLGAVGAAATHLENHATLYSFTEKDILFQSFNETSGEDKNVWVGVRSKRQLRKKKQRRNKFFSLGKEISLP